MQSNEYVNLKGEYAVSFQREQDDQFIICAETDLRSDLTWLYMVISACPILRASEVVHRAHLVTFPSIITHRNDGRSIYRESYCRWIAASQHIIMPPKVTRRRRRSANGAGPEPAGPSTSNARESSDISHAALPNDPNFSLYQGEIEGVEPEVTVEEFLRWSAAGASTSTKRSRKTRRFVNLTEPSRDLVQFSEVEHVVVPPTRKRRRALPQLPASDDEYQPSEDEQQGRPVRKRKTYKGKGRSLSRRMLHAAVLSHVDVGPNSFPTGAPGRQPLKFAAVHDADASPPPAILNAHKLRLIDPRSTTLQPSVFGKRLVSVAKNPLTKPRFNYRIPSPLRGSSSTQAAKSVPNSRKGCDNQRAQEFVTNRKEASASPLRYVPYLYSSSKKLTRLSA